MKSDEYSTLYDKVVQHAERLTGDNELAKDLVQETYLRLYEYRDRYLPTNPLALLLTILNNLYADELRRKFRLYALSRELAVQTTTANKNAPYSADFTQISKQMQMKVQGYTYQEIAKALNVPVGTIKSSISRERHRLKLLL